MKFAEEYKEVFILKSHTRWIKRGRIILDRSSVNYDVNRVNKFICSIILLFTVLLSAQAFIARGLNYGIIVTACTGLASLIAWIAFSLHKKSKIPAAAAAVIIPLCPAILALILSFLENGGISLKLFMIFVFSVCASGLYFKKDYVIYNGAILNILLILIAAVAPDILMDGEFTLKEFVTRTVLVDASALVIYFLTRWGSEYLDAAVKVLDKLQETMKKVENTVNVLTSGIAKSDSELENISSSSANITSAMGEISKGVQSEADSISKIVGDVGTANKNLQELQALSRNIRTISSEVSGVVSKNSDDMEVMRNQINTIGSVVEEALNTVNELDSVMNSINEAITAITEIAGRTNMLALNAAIESARAGEHGKGFAVVAEEVRKLAEQSGSTAKNINNTILAAREKSKMALEKVQEGSAAVKTGNKVVDEVNTGFRQINESFNTMDSHIEKENKMIEGINTLYSNIQSNLDSMAAIVEEHASAGEEILATTENQNGNITEIAKISKEIASISRELSMVLEK